MNLCIKLDNVSIKVKKKNQKKKTVYFSIPQKHLTKRSKNIEAANFCVNLKTFDHNCTCTKITQTRQPRTETKGLIQVRNNREHPGEGGDRNYKKVGIIIGKAGKMQIKKLNKNKSTWPQHRERNRHTQGNNVETVTLFDEFNTLG